MDSSASRPLRADESIGTPITGTAVHAVTQKPSLAMIAAATKAALEHPYIKSKIAIALSTRQLPTTAKVVAAPFKPSRLTPASRITLPAQEDRLTHSEDPLHFSGGPPKQDEPPKPIASAKPFPSSALEQFAKANDMTPEEAKQRLLTEGYEVA